MTPTPDLVGRLRNEADGWEVLSSEDESVVLLREAADHIEKLERVRQAAERVMDDYYGDSPVPLHLAALRAAIQESE